MNTQSCRGTDLSRGSLLTKRLPKEKVHDTKLLYSSDNNEGYFATSALNECQGHNQASMLPLKWFINELEKDLIFKGNNFISYFPHNKMRFPEEEKILFLCHMYTYIYLLISSTTMHALYKACIESIFLFPKDINKHW